MPPARITEIKADTANVDMCEVLASRTFFHCGRIIKQYTHFGK